MQVEIKDKWVAALRSGEYVQGRGQLRTSVDEFCCLGVLCSIYALENSDFTATHTDHNGYEYDGEWLVLPTGVQQWAGLPDEQVVLIEMNDGNSTFDEIADYIEENY